MNQNNTLKNRCKVVSPKDEDNFVGIKADTSQATVYFPLGYELSNNDEEIRKEIFQLFNILSIFGDDKGHVSKQNYDDIKDVAFPLNDYMEIIYYYMQYGYYKETDPIFKTRERGKINWPRTIKNQKPFLISNEDKTLYYPVYTKFIVRTSAPNEDKEITRIHQHCVYESFKKLGWIFTSHMPPKPIGSFNKKRFLIILQNKLVNTNNDIKKRLFQSMINMINFWDEKPDNKFHFGTENFEVIWEKLIDEMFCNVPNKNDFYPRANWNLKSSGKYEIPFPLKPDSIMIYKNNVYIIDAKYYKYGITKNDFDLPKNSDVNKQISYGDYVNSKNLYDNIYNAFLMPYNKDNNKVGFDEIFENIGEAEAPWRKNTSKYEHIQGILVDIKFLMSNYKNKSDNNISNLAKAIEESFKNNQKLY